MKPVIPMLRGLPRDHFRLTAVDVPWKYVVRSSKGLGKSADRHYGGGVMTLDQIADLPIGDHCHPHSKMLFWITGPFLAIGAHVPIMRAWGFEPTAIWGVWVKPTLKAWREGGVDPNEYFKMGMGHTSRQNAEYVIEGRRGNPPERLSKGVRQVMVEPAREHSRKPEIFFKRAEEYAGGPRLELFARQARKGWTCRGDEVNKFRSEK